MDGPSPASGSRRSAGRAGPTILEGDAAAPRRRGGARGRHGRRPRASASATRSQVQAATAFAGGPPPPARAAARRRAGDVRGHLPAGGRRGPARRRARWSPDRRSRRCSAPTRTCPSGRWHASPTAPSPDGAHRRQPRGHRGRGRHLDAVVHRCPARRARPARRGVDRCWPVPSRSSLLLLASCSCRAAGRAPASSARRPARAAGARAARGRQLARAAAWQPVPAGLAALVIGVPLGIAAGRLGFSAFARSIAVVDDPSSPPWLVRRAGPGRRRCRRRGARSWPGRSARRVSERRHPPRRRGPPRLSLQTSALEPHRDMLAAAYGRSGQG